MSSGQVPRTVNKPWWLWLLSVLVTSASSTPAPSGARLKSLKSSRVKKMATEPSARASLSGDGAHTQWTGGPMQAEPEKRPVRDQMKGPFAWQSVRQQSAIRSADRA